MSAQQTGQTRNTQRCGKPLSRRKMRRPPSWVSHFRRLRRNLASSMRMIDETMAAVVLAAEQAVHSPLRTVRDLDRLSAILIAASIRLDRAVRGLQQTSNALVRDPRRAADATRLLMQATQQWVQIAKALAEVSERLFTLQEGLVDDLESGRRAMEPQVWPRRRRRIAVHRIQFAREFLRSRRSRAHDRIASIPLRRRRTACRATTDAPRRICRGRAPPVSSNCLL